MKSKNPSDWNQVLSSLNSLDAVTWAGLLVDFEVPKPGNFVNVRDRRFLATRAGGVDGIVLGVAPRRAACLVAVEIPGKAAIAVVADSPAVLETVVADVMSVLRNSHVIVAP